MQPKILVAEDEPRRAYFLRNSLQAAGFQVLEATDSAKAWKIIRTQKLAMALIDANLPGLSEHNLLPCLRSDPALAKLPVLVLGDALATEQAIRWLNLGADGYISRSISSTLLRAQVHAKLRRTPSG